MCQAILKVIMQSWEQSEDAPLALLSFNSSFELTWANKEAGKTDGRLVPGADVRLLFSGLETESATEWFRSGQGKLASNALTGSGERLFLHTWLPVNGDGCYLSLITKDPGQSFLERRRELLAEAADQAWESICITDAELDMPGPRFLYVNRGFEVLTGFAESEVIGKHPASTRVRSRTSPF